MMRTRKRKWWWQHWREGWPMTPLSIQDKIQKFRSTDKSREKQNHIDTWRCRKKATKNYKGW
jgi:hypothetical protein